MLALLRNDGGDGCNRSSIAVLQGGELLLQVPKNYALHSHGCSRNGVAPKKAGQQSQSVPTQPAKPVTAATRLATTSQLSAEDEAMPKLVRPKFRKRADVITSREPSHENLARVDADSAVLARMVDLDDAVPERAGVHGSRSRFQRQPSTIRSAAAL